MGYCKMTLASKWRKFWYALPKRADYSDHPHAGITGGVSGLARSDGERRFRQIRRRAGYEVTVANTHNRRRHDSTVEVSRVGGVNAPVGSHDPVYNVLCC